MIRLRIFALLVLASSASIAHAQSAPTPAQASACSLSDDNSEQPHISPCASPPGKTTEQVHQELMQARDNGYLTFGELDYPPALPGMGSRLSRTEIRAELAQSNQMGTNTSGELDYPYGNS